MKAIFTHKKKANKSDAWTFYFKPEEPMQQTAGQFTELTLTGVGKHWFTMSSRPGTPEVTITTRLTGSDFKNALDSLAAGDKVDLEEAMGDFVLPIDKSIPIVMAAGGIGITPFLSILSDCLSKSDKRNLNLIYAARTEDDYIALSEYKSVLTSFKKVTGKLDVDTIYSVSSKLTNPYVYVSGPEPMVEALVAQLKVKGLKQSQLVADYFPGYTSI